MTASFLQRAVSFSLAAVITGFMLGTVDFLAQPDAPLQHWAQGKSSRA